MHNDANSLSIPQGGKPTDICYDPHNSFDLWVHSSWLIQILILKMTTIQAQYLVRQGNLDHVNTTPPIHHIPGTMCRDQ